MALKITQLTAGTDPVDGDLLETSQNVSIVPASRKISFSQVRTYLNNYLLQKSNNLSDVANVATARTNLGLGTMATQSASSYLALAGGTMTGALNMGGFAITNLLAPVAGTDAANKTYVDSQTGGGAPFIQGVYAASTANLTGYTYNNGTAGVGATLTAPSNGTFSLDGFAVPVGQRILYKDDSTGSGAYNGVYIVTTSTAGSPAVLTRATDYNSIANMLLGRVINIQNGTQNGGSEYMQISAVNTVGTDAVSYYLLFAVSQYAQNTLPTVANRIPSYNNTTGLLQNAGATTSTVLTSVNPISITVTPNSVTGLTINGTTSGFNTSARLDLITATAGQTRSIISMGGASSSCQFVYDTVNSPTGLSVFMSTAGTQVTTWDTTGNFNMRISGTTPKLILGSTGSASTGAFTWDGTSVFPYFGSRAMVTQNGVATVGAYAQWDGAGSLVSGGIPGQLLAVKTLTSTTSASYVQTAGTRNIVIYAQGAGGGGGGGTTAVSCGSGGSSGALAIWAGPVYTFTYQCGTGGAGGVGSGTGVGTGGGSTTITAFTPGNITATGGFGGNPGTTAPGFATVSSTVATATGGKINITGQRGRYGMLYSSTFVYGGDGGDSFFGFGGQGQIVSTTNTFSSGGAGSGYGTGGGGGANVPTGSAPNGGAGQNGVIIVYEYS